MITPAVINEYKASGGAKDALQYLDDPDATTDQGIMTLRAHTRVRNYLVLMLAVNNATRAGGITEMTIAQFQGAVYCESRDNYVIQVI